MAHRDIFSGMHLLIDNLLLKHTQTTLSKTTQNTWHFDITRTFAQMLSEMRFAVDIYVKISQI